MKTIKFVMFALLLSNFVPLNLAHAYTDNPYAELYAVGSNGSTVAQSYFTIDQQPWLFIKFYNAPAAGSFDNIINLSTWQNTTNMASYSPTVGTSNANEIWISFSQSQWNAIKALGTWDTSEISLLPGSAQPLVEQASFTVNAAPEPTSTVLFMIGALVLGINILRRNKVIAV